MVDFGIFFSATTEAIDSHRRPMRLQEFGQGELALSK